VPATGGQRKAAPATERGYPKPGDCTLDAFPFLPHAQAMVPPQLKPFTSESARAAARKRWDAPKPLPPPQPIAPVERDAWLHDRLLRVRLILERMDAMAAKVMDAQELSWLATAAARWSEQEFDLAGRPKPGNRRPGPERAGPKAGVFWGQPMSAPTAPPPAPEPGQDAPVRFPESPTGEAMG
jgi:hypothetical protein